MATSSVFGVALRAAGTALVLDLSDGLLPAVVHWGADCGQLSAGGYAALREGGIAPIAPSEPDVSVRVAILPEHTAGWFGRPGVSGSRAGTAWSPRWRVTSAELDGLAIAATGEASAVINHGAGRLVVQAADADAELALTLTVELTGAGIVRTRATLENLGTDIYQLDELLLCLPTPAYASEVLDFAGRWGQERAPQRLPMTIGTHRREGRRGRTGLDAAFVLNAGTPGFGFAQGEV